MTHSLKVRNKGEQIALLLNRFSSHGQVLIIELKNIDVMYIQQNPLQKPF